MEDAETARRAAPFRFAGMERKKKKQLAGRRTEERIRRKTITVHPLKSFSSPVNRTPCTQCFFSIEITMRWLTSKNHCVYSVRTNEEREREERKTKNDQTTRRRNMDEREEREGIWKVKLNFDEGRNIGARQWIVTYASMFANGRCRASLLILLGRVSPVSGNFQSRKTGTKPPIVFFFHPSLRFFDPVVPPFLSIRFRNVREA